MCVYNYIYGFPSYFRQVTGAQPKCPIDPFFIVPDKCKCVDFQTLKLQEAPESVPTSELPRHLQLYCDRYLCEKVVPGNRVTIVGIYSIKKMAKATKVSRTFIPLWRGWLRRHTIDTNDQKIMGSNPG